MFSLKPSVTTSLLAVAMFCGGLFASGSHMDMDHSKKASTSTQAEAGVVAGTQKVCPISKKPIDPTSYSVVQGQRVYYCCQGCEKKFLKDTDAKFAEMKERGEVATSMQTVCPVSGETLEDHDTSITLPGRQIYFCCKKCMRKFKDNPEKYLSKMDSKVEEAKVSHDDDDMKGMTDGDDKKGSRHHSENE